MKKCILRKKTTKSESVHRFANPKVFTDLQHKNNDRHQTSSLSYLWKKKFHRQQCALKRSKIRLETLKKLILSQQAKINKLKKEDVILLKNVRYIRYVRNTKNVHKGNYGCNSTNKFERASIHKRLCSSFLCIFAHRVRINLKKNDILPLLCVRTIGRYLSTVNIKCGFDKHFFEMFKKYIEKKSLQKHGLLLIDEISLQESISVNSSNLTYKGLIDFGKDGKKAKSLDEKATSGLFQLLADNYTQPIAVFASRGPVKGVELAKLVIQAIFFLENAGVLVHGIISNGKLDAGAETNQKMWSELGVCGKMDNLKNWFTHPVNNERKVFAFSDTPHLIKCIRNRVCSKDKHLRLDPNKSFVQWKHFEAPYDIDKSVSTTQLRVCPKLTLNHLELSNTSKMKVRLTTQIFSNSIVHGLKFYKAHGVPELQDCEATQLIFANGLMICLIHSIAKS
ncbi:DNA transposase THAP9 isoform X9 [Anoplolepis gracilipes]